MKIYCVVCNYLEVLGLRCELEKIELEMWNK